MNGRGKSLIIKKIIKETKDFIIMSIDNYRELLSKQNPVIVDEPKDCKYKGDNE